MAADLGRSGRHTRTWALHGPHGPVEMAHQLLPREAIMIYGAGHPDVRLLLEKPDGPLLTGEKKVRVERERGLRRDTVARAAVTVSGRRYRLSPCSMRSSAITRDGECVAEADGGYTRYFRPWRITPGREAVLAWRPAADPLDVAVTFLLVTAYGTGAPHPFVRLGLRLGLRVGLSIWN